MTDDVPLREHLEAQNVALEKRLNATIAYFREELTKLDIEHEQRRIASFDQANRAIDKAEDALSKRLDLLNEFRAQVRDQSAHFVNRETYEARHIALDNRITQIEASGTGARRAMAVTFTVATLVVAVLAFTLPFIVTR